jgi:hypothetical protein
MGKSTANRSSRLKLTALSASLCLLGAIAMSGCLPSVGQTLYKGHVDQDIPYFDEGSERIANYQCRWWGAQFGAPPYHVDIRCNVALSTGVSDAANDIHTVSRYFPNYEEAVLNWGASGCGNGVYQGLLGFASSIHRESPFYEAVLRAYASAQKGAFVSHCRTGLGALWHETDNNTYSGGHRCAGLGVTFRITSVNLPPTIRDLTTYPIDDSGDNPVTPPGCTQERLQYTIDLPGPFNTILHWGDGPNE